MKRAVLVLTLPFVLSACAYVNGEHHVVLKKSPAVLVDYDLNKMKPEEALQRATEQCGYIGKKPELQSSSTGNGGAKPSYLQADFYRCV